MAPVAAVMATAVVEGLVGWAGLVAMGSKEVTLVAKRVVEDLAAGSVVELEEETAVGFQGAEQVGQVEAWGVTTDQRGGWARGREEGMGSAELVEVVREQGVEGEEEYREDRLAA